MGRTFRLLVCALVVCPPAAFAQRFDDFGIRAQGMAGAFVAVADDSSATWWNPAGLANALTFVDVSASILKDGGRSVALGFPSLGVSYYRLRVSQIQPSGTTTGTAFSGRQDNGAVGSGLSSVEFGMSQFGLSAGQSLGRHFVVATTVKLVNAVDDTEADLDVGAMAAFGVMRLGVAVHDVRQPTFGSGVGAFELTRRARAGAAVITRPRGRIGRLTIAADADLTQAPIDGLPNREVAAGAEAWWLSGRIGVRGGGGRNIAAGGGPFGAFGVTVVPYPRLNLDGAVTRSSDPTIGDRWSLGVRLTY
jgi:hypothetical protein